MPTTDHVHRLNMIVPAAKVPAVVAWFQNQIGPDSLPPGLGPPLNATGNPADPVTHNWCCASYTDPECKAILVKMCQNAGLPVPTPAQWDNATQPQKLTWLLSVRDAVLAQFGAWINLAMNEGQWDSPQEALDHMSLKTISQPVTG
jgi:hypothetical protein